MIWQQKHKQTLQNIFHLKKKQAPNNDVYNVWWNSEEMFENHEKQNTNKYEPTSSSPLAGRMVGWLAPPESKNEFKLTYVKIWQLKHQQPLQNMFQNENKPQIIAYVMFSEIQERCMKTLKTKQNKK